jgi:energy-converting hydrogenase Eha subunit H
MNFCLSIFFFTHSVLLQPFNIIDKNDSNHKLNIGISMVSISRITLLVAVSCEGSISCRYNRDLIIIMQSTAPTASGSASVTGGSISFHETSFTIN